MQNIQVDRQGVQTTTPINANGTQNGYLNLYMNKQYKSNPKFIYSWNAGGNINYNRSKLFYNEVQSWQSTYNMDSWVGINLNINDKVECNNWVMKSWNFTRYTADNFKKLDIVNTRLNSEIIIRWPKHFIWETQLSYEKNNALPDPNNNVVRWNAALNYTMLRSEALVLRLSVFDILNQNQNYYSAVSRNTIRFYQTNALPRYGLLTLTYNVRPKAGKKADGKNRFLLF